tara:strand:+ start:3418 stop:3786 length:369 start_codon:yes stop_codon:yes gene_type:complete
MNFNENVDKDFVGLVLESALWAKAGVKVDSKAINEDTNEGDIGNIAELEGDMNKYEEPSTIEEDEVEEEEQETFSLADLQVVLDNLDDEDLMEHAMNMLDVFDVAYENLNEDEEAEEEEEEE